MLRLRLTSLDRDAEPRRNLLLVAEVEIPDGDRIEVPLREGAPGIYRAEVAIGEPGRFEISVTVPHDRTVPIPTREDQAVTAAWHHSYPVEYDFGRISGGSDQLARLPAHPAMSTEEIMAAGSGIAWRWQPGWRFWALLALAVFTTELVRRYSAFSGRRRSQAPKGRT